MSIDYNVVQLSFAAHEVRLELSQHGIDGTKLARVPHPPHIQLLPERNVRKDLCGHRIVAEDPVQVAKVARGDEEAAQIACLQGGRHRGSMRVECSCAGSATSLLSAPPGALPPRR